MTARPSSPSLKTAWFGAQRSCIRRTSQLHLASEIAFSVEASVRRRGVGSILFRKLITEARAKGYKSLRITTGAQNEAMRALANKFGAQLVFRHGESTGTIDLTKQDHTELATTWADTHAECRAHGREFQPRLLADAAADVWLGPRRLSGGDSVRAIR